MIAGQWNICDDLDINHDAHEIQERAPVKLSRVTGSSAVGIEHLLHKTSVFQRRDQNPGRVH